MRGRAVALRSLQLRDDQPVVFLSELVNLPGIAVLRNTKAGLLDERLTAKLIEDLVRILDRNRIFDFGSLECSVIGPAAAFDVQDGFIADDPHPYAASRIRRQ